MGTVSRIWLALAGFLAAAGVVYGLTSHEVAGAPLLLVGGGVFAYLGFVAVTEVRRSGGGDEAEADPEAKPEEPPHVGPTIWPLGFSVAAVLLAVGFIVSKLILVLGGVAFVVSAAGWLRDITRSHAHGHDA